MIETMSARAAAACCGVSERTLRRWIAAGRLHADKQGGTFLVSLEDVRTLTADRRTPAADTAAVPDMSAAPNTEASEVADSPAADTLRHHAALVSLVAQLHAEVSAAKDEAREYATAAAIWQERARVLADQLALKAPERPQEAQPAPEPAPASPGATRTDVALVVAHCGGAGRRLGVRAVAGVAVVMDVSDLIASTTGCGAY